MTPQLGPQMNFAEKLPKNMPSPLSSFKKFEDQKKSCCRVLVLVGFERGAVRSTFNFLTDTRESIAARPKEFTKREFGIVTSENVLRGPQRRAVIRYPKGSAYKVPKGSAYKVQWSFYRKIIQ